DLAVHVRTVAVNVNARAAKALACQAVTLSVEVSELVEVLRDVRELLGDRVAVRGARLTTRPAGRRRRRSAMSAAWPTSEASPSPATFLAAPGRSRVGPRPCRQRMSVRSRTCTIGSHTTPPSSPPTATLILSW